MNIKKDKSNEIHIVSDAAIQASKIIIIGGEDKKFIANVSIAEALAMAKEQKLNLIQIHASDDTATCIIADINKYRYAYNKKNKAPTAQKTKEVRINARSDLSDLLRNLEQCCNFILEKNLAVTLILKAHKKGFDGKDAFITQYFDANPNIMHSIQKSPKPNLIKLYVTKKSGKPK